MIKFISCRIFFFLLILFSASVALAQAPAGYYDGTSGLTGEPLKLKLHQIIKGHQVYTYSQIKDILMDVDEDPGNTNNIKLIYKGGSIPKTNFATNNEPDFWNREHTWPKSHGFPDDVDTAYTDAHMLRPSDASVNSDRSNKDFNNVEHIAANEQGEAPDTYTTDDFWEPRDEVKGDLARIMFYMDTRYESPALDLELVDRPTYLDAPELGVLYTLLDWHEQDPVSQEEIDRNNGIYGYQGNRNPFVDNPDWVADIWGSTSNPLILLDKNAFSEDFGWVAASNSLTQVYSVSAYNLAGDVAITTQAPFALSLDNVNFSSSVTIVNDAGQTKQEVDIYLRFSPTVADGAVYNEIVTHTSSGANTVEMFVTGQEGEIPLETIAEARSANLGEVVKVTGVVIDKQNNSGNSRVIYDGTAGIVVRSFDAGNESAPLVHGDSVVVTGKLGEYNGLRQISESPITIDLIKQNAEVAAPQEVVIADVGESHESELIIVKNVTFVEEGSTFAGGGAAGNFTITDGANELTFRIGDAGHPLVGTTVPHGIYDIVGVVGQFAGDYQLSPRNADDLIFVATDNTSLSTIAVARTESLGSRVKVTGVVIDGAGNSADNRTIFDGTAGIVVRSFDSGNESAPLIIGDSVTVSGILDDYNELLQISGSPIYIELLKTNVGLPDPQVLTVSQIDEDDESELVTIEGFSFTSTGTFQGGGTSGEYIISNGTDDFIFKLGTTSHPLTGTDIPSGILNITGVIGQSGTNFYIAPRTVQDIVKVGDVTGLTEGKKYTGLEVYPNPTYDIVYFNAENRKPYKIAVTDITGKSVSVLIGHNYVDLSSLERGIYLLILSNSETNHVIRVVKK